MKKTIKLCQGQVWRQGEEYFRIVRLERLEVEYKATTTLTAKKGTHHKVTKKEFCRLIKQAELLGPTNTPADWAQLDTAPDLAGRAERRSPIRRVGGRNSRPAGSATGAPGAVARCAPTDFGD